MSKQNISISRTKKQNEILDLEKKYFCRLESIIQSESFTNDLLLIEKEIRENYPKFKDTWDLKNKIKVPAERVIRHHVYLEFSKEIKGIYPSPISSDLGIKLDDCVLCIDSKTLDTENNAGDIKATAVESNQISFDNSNHKYVKGVSNLESIDHYSRLPVLTFIIKIIYTDDQYSFKLSRWDHPSIVLACVPNGELSNLFDRDIIQNFKTYSYYSKKDNACFEAHTIPAWCNTSVKKADYTRDYCIDKGFVEVELERSKKAYFDPAHLCLWWLTSQSNKAVIAAVKNGASTRVFNSILEERYDSKDKRWKGYKEYQLPDPLP